MEQWGELVLWSQAPLGSDPAVLVALGKLLSLSVSDPCTLSPHGTVGPGLSPVLLDDWNGLLTGPAPNPATASLFSQESKLLKTDSWSLCSPA